MSLTNKVFFSLARSRGNYWREKKGGIYTGRITGIFPEPTNHVLGFGEEVIAAGGEIEEMDFMHNLRIK